MIASLDEVLRQVGIDPSMFPAGSTRTWVRAGRDGGGCADGILSRERDDLITASVVVRASGEPETTADFEAQVQPDGTVKITSRLAYDDQLEPLHRFNEAVADLPLEQAA